MFGYNVEKKKIDEALQQIYRNFAKSYNDVEKEDLSDAEKEERRDYLIEVAVTHEDILRNAQSLSELSDFDKEILGITEESEPPKVDTNVVDTLVSIYAKRVKIPSQHHGIGILDNITLRDGEQLEDIDTTAFEEDLRQYFTEHYYDLLSDGYNDFLSEATEVPDNIGILHNKYGDITQMAQRHNLDPERLSHFGYQFTIQDGVVAEEDKSLGRANIFYATPEGVNQRAYDLYSQILFREKKGEEVGLFNSVHRNLKNAYITYAEKNGIEIQDRVVLEEIPVDMDKVRGVARYINRELNNNGHTAEDITEELAADIQKNYSKIMNLDFYNFGDLETVKRATDGKYTSLFLSINEDSVLKTDDFRPDIAYGTPEYVKKEYERVMREIARLSNKDAFIDGPFDINKANRKKDALRRYITESGIEGIDISITEVEVDHERTGMIADAIMSKYGEQCEDKEEMRARILKRIEDRYPELVTGRPVIELDNLVGEELREMGNNLVMEYLYMQDDFTYIGGFDGYRGQCVYATPEALQEKISMLDEKISARDLNFDEKRMREQLVKYAKDNNFEIEIPDVESVEHKRQEEKDIFSYKGGALGFLGRDMLPDDPTARPKIQLEDTMFDVIYKMSEGLPGAIVGITALMNADSNGFMLLLGLDDMNIRGSQIWEAYKYLYHEDGKKFAEAIINRREDIVDFVNQELASVGKEKSVTGGASFDRNKTPDKYRFTELEVEELKKQREERIQKQNEIREKLLANSPAKKKSLGQKRREDREAKRKAYREKLIANGKRSIGELDDELTGLQGKERQAKELYGRYEEQLESQTEERRED